MRESSRIIYDFWKFIPFSLFLIVPGLEVALPLYLLLFPNSIPTWYIFDHVWDTQIEKLENRQREAHEQLAGRLKDFLQQRGMSSEDFLNEKKYKSTIIKNMNLIDK